MNETIVLLAQNGKSVNLKGGFNSLLSALNVSTSFWTLLLFIGVAMAFWGIGRHIVDRRRGGDADMKTMFWWVIAGALIAAPGSFGPPLLGIADWAINGILSALNRL